MLKLRAVEIHFDQSAPQFVGQEGIFRLDEIAVDPQMPSRDNLAVEDDGRGALEAPDAGRGRDDVP